MADNITETNATEQPNVPDASQELAQHMAIALNNGIIPQEQITDQNTEVVTPETTDVVVPPPLTFETIKEKFNYQSPEDAIKEIEELRKFKENPVAEIEFENEASRKLFEAIKGGKQKEAYAILAEQERLDTYSGQEVTKDNAADIIKLGMQIKYKDLSPSEIDYKYKKTFGLPKEPVQSASETEDEFEERMNEWKNDVSDIEMDKILEAKLTKPELESHKQKLVLPDIEADIDEDYQSWKQSKEDSSKVNAETVEAYKAFTPKTIETKISFNDEANKVAFDFQYEPTVEDLKKSVDLVSDINKFYAQFIGQDGKPDRQRFLKAVHFANNAESILMEAMKQAKNATLKATLPDNGAIVRQLPQQQQVSELDANMRLAGIIK